MTRVRLRTELLIAALLIVCGLMGAVLVIVRRSVRAGIDRQVGVSMDALVHAFESLQDQREMQLSRTAAMLAELPPLKALMTTNDPRTVQDGSSRFWRLSGSDLFILADSQGRVMALHLRRSGWQPQQAERVLSDSILQHRAATWWYGAGQLYQVFLYPITAGSGGEREPLGVVAVGFQADDAVAAQLAMTLGTQIAIGSGHSLVASTLPPGEQEMLARRLAQGALPPGSGTHRIDLGRDRFEGASVHIQAQPPFLVEGYVLMPLGPMEAFAGALNRTLLIAGSIAMVLAALLLGFVARTMTRPLDSLVAGVRALAAGEYTYPIAPRGSSEVAELSEAFAAMREELLASQRRSLAAERLTALGRAASSISHDLRHYMAAVVANAEFLYEAEKLHLDRDEIYQEIKMASEQMIDLLDSLRELAKQEPALAVARGSLWQTLQRAVDAALARTGLPDRAIQVQAVGDPDGVFDPRKIERAFFNLILNACEATARTGGEVTIGIRSSPKAFEIRVGDNGAGIPAQIRETLFDPFVSAGKPSGTGLGLAIAAKIFHDHDGAIGVEKTASTGTVFLVRLPRFAKASFTRK